MRIVNCFLIMLMTSFLLKAQPYHSSVEEVNDWNGWKAIVVGNGLITTSTVPAIGARVMQYDLGDYPSIYQDASLFGKTYLPAAGSNWHNFGGFKNWPASQNGTGRWDWPPPPTLDIGNYTSESISIPEKTARIELRIYSDKGAMVGTLDGVDMENITDMDM